MYMNDQSLGTTDLNYCYIAIYVNFVVFTYFKE